MNSLKRYSVWQIAPTQKELLKPLAQVLTKVPPLRSRSNKPLAMNTEELLNILTYYHLQEFTSGTELVQTLQEDDYAREFVAPAGGIINIRLSLIRLMNAGLSSFLLYLLNYRNRLQEHYPPRIRSLVIL